MNRQAKTAIKSLVLTLRHKLEDDIAIQLKRYGFAGERWLTLDRLPHIEGDNRAASDHFRLKSALDQHLRRIGADPEKDTPKQRAEAVEWFVREVAFTHLNRLVALKCLEVRRLVDEIITAREAYGGRSRAHYDYRNAHPEEARQADDALPAAIRHVCQQVYAEFKFLFDVGDPATGRPPPANSILWPANPVLRGCVALLNGLDEAAGNDGRTLWAEDEIIGWIYQFYNAEEKEAIRKRGKPRRPAEVAVINQFFTPRWIVKFLVDNTLGRLWLEMHPDSQRVREKCDYLVPEPLAADESQSTTDRSRFPLDPDSPINDPTAPPRRPSKRPQDVRLIDPACGTMHFGHYAFEVFKEIYRDARDHGWVTGADALPDEELPAAILRHNLYGVDIDLRAVQLAGLSLFIKAKTANPKAHISQVNLVVADAVLPPDGARQRFLDQYDDDKVVRGAVEQVLDDMGNVAEVGSLLRVEERLREELAKAGHAAVRGWDAERQEELPGFEPPARQLSLAEVSGTQPEEWGAHYTVARLLDDLRAFAGQALQTHDLNAQLFAQEAEKSVHLLDVFLNDYDVVVMNPPYGDATEEGRDHIKSAFPSTKNDIYAAFFERSLDFLQGCGYVGALTSRTFLTLSSFEDLRQEVLFRRGHPYVALDLGFGILDGAIVETCASVLRSDRHPIADTRATFFRLNHFEGDERQERFESAVGTLKGMKLAPFVFCVPLVDFLQIPSTAIAYWAPGSLRAKFSQLPLLSPILAEVRQGLASAYDERFVRQSWEVETASIGRNRKWVAFAKGGDYSKFYYDFDLVVNWGSDGEEIKSYRWPSGRQRSRPQNEQFYFTEGLTYVYITVKGFNARYLPPDHIFGHAGNSIFPKNGTPLWPLLGLLNSSTTQFLLSLLTDSRKYEVGYVSSIPIPDLTEAEMLGASAQKAYSLKATWDTGNEIGTRFDAPWLILAHRGTLLPDFQDLHPANKPTDQLASLLDYVRAVEQAGDAHVQSLQAQIDEVVYDLYEISSEDRALIQRELGERPKELVWPQMEGKSDQEKPREHVRRLISYFLVQALKEKRDGIVPLTPGAGQTTALDEVRRRMEAEFGEEAAFKMESDIKRVLGRDIADWLDGPFVRWHTKLYKRRPIIWHLSSPRNLFGCFAYIHRLDRDTLRKVQTQYLWPHRRAAEAELDVAQRAKAAGERGAAHRIDQTDAFLDDLAEFEKRLLAVIEGQVECEIPDWAEGPYRGGVYDPVLDDGVKVNITPLQEGEVLRYKQLI